MQKRSVVQMFTIVTVVLAIVALPLYAAEYFVSASGDNSTYTSWATAAHSIQDAVDAAGNSDTVWVTNGIYTGTGDNVVTISNSITLISVNGYDYTTIDAEGARRGVLTTKNSYALITGFKITGGFLDTLRGAGVSLWDSTVSNCLITANKLIGSQRGAGICLTEPNTYLKNSIITLNTNATEHGGGVACYWGGEVENCLITKNSAGYGGGITIAGNSAVARVRNCTITENVTPGATRGSGIEVASGASIAGLVQNCIIFNNRAGASLVLAYDVNNMGSVIFEYNCIRDYGGNLNGAGNISSDPLFVNSAGDDYHPIYGSSAINAGTNLSAYLTHDLDGNVRTFGAYDMGAYEYAHTPTTYYVSASGDNSTYTNWATAAHEIQSAVDAAYYLGGDTVLVGDGTYTGTGNNVVEMTNNTTLKSANGYAGVIIDGEGARRGLLMDDPNLVNSGLADGITISNCLHNFDSRGGGAYVRRGTLQNSLIIKNKLNAYGNGGGVFIGGTGSEISSYLKNCIVKDNINKGRGGGISAYWGGQAENCLIIGNSSSYSVGGGVATIRGLVRNCTIVGNESKSDQGGSGLAREVTNYSSRVENCIIWGNIGVTNVLNEYNLVTFDSCCIEDIDGTYGGGSNNIASDPLFKSTDNYHLQSGSPCVDTGMTVSDLVIDLDGVMRPQDGNSDGSADYDMGTYELEAPKGTVILVM